MMFEIVALLSFNNKIASGSASGSMFAVGITLLFGVTAYKSAKKRRLGKAEGAIIRRSVGVFLYGVYSVRPKSIPSSSFRASGRRISRTKGTQARMIKVKSRKSLV